MKSADETRATPARDVRAHNAEAMLEPSPHSQASPLSLAGLALALSAGAAVSLGITRFAYGLLLPEMRADLGWNYAQCR